MKLAHRVRGWLRRKARELIRLVVHPDTAVVPRRFQVFAEAFDARSDREAWVRFATDLAAQAYRDGFAAGYETHHRQSLKQVAIPMVARPQRPHTFAWPRSPFEGVPPHRVPELVAKMARAANNGVRVVMLPERKR